MSNSSLGTAALAATGAVVGATVLVVGIPAAVSILGFGAGGIVAGSVAAHMMGPATAAGGVVATLQSIGAAGLGAPGTAVAGTVGSAVGAGVGAMGRPVVNGASSVLSSAGSYIGSGVSYLFGRR